ncbi:hypothetical protein EVAR_28088_1 [Eumeta japonica]|uniref:Uncharacterized protein n=1 Tax=Eumeta variegata TaxID=151549 RepID=A0A4C1WC29_EUMVA|nr:hypothetical protein EVAR_28088_1 [Eumeta japonica]
MLDLSLAKCLGQRSGQNANAWLTLELTLGLCLAQRLDQRFRQGGPGMTSGQATASQWLPTYFGSPSDLRDSLRRTLNAVQTATKLITEYAVRTRSTNSKVDFASIASVLAILTSQTSFVNIRRLRQASHHTTPNFKEDASALSPLWQGIRYLMKGSFPREREEE